MRRVLVVAAVAVVLPAALARPDAETYSPSGGGYSVKFPGRPQETTRKVKAGGGEVEVRVATYATSRGEAYMTSVTPAGVRPGNPQDYLGSVVKGVAAGFEGTLTRTQAIDVGEDKAPGLSFTVEKDKGRTLLKGVVVLHDDRLYQVAVSGPKGFVEGREAKAFLESFKLTK
jgi:hypothetical protein